jgi:hypothetical protein
MRIVNKYEEDENEFWHDFKIKGKDVRFPDSNKQSSKVTTYKIEELINK